MKPERRTTKACHHCGRHSWEIANGNPCLWCNHKNKSTRQIIISTLVGISIGVILIGVVAAILENI